MTSFVHRTPSQCRRISVVGDIYTFLLTGEETDGNLMLVDAHVPPGGGPPPHVHSREDETFTVLEGTMTFYADGSRLEAGPGEVIHLPRGVKHHFRNESDQPVRVLIQCSPAGIEEMFTEVGTPVGPGEGPAPVTPEAIEQLLAACPRYGIEVDLPPR